MEGREGQLRRLADLEKRADDAERDRDALWDLYRGLAAEQERRFGELPPAESNR